MAAINVNETKLTETTTVVSVTNLSFTNALTSDNVQ
jgi:hypothetical protein